MPEAAWRLRKARELVKLLALARGHRLHREQAMDALWRDLDPAAAANNLNQAVHVARRALGAEAIERRDELLGSAPRSTWTASSRRPRTHAARGTPAAYRAALALYGGELLPENRYDEWASGRREELRLAGDLAGSSSARRRRAAAGCPPRRARSSAASTSSRS